MARISLGGHRGLGCTDHDFYQSLRDIAALPVENTQDSLMAAFAAGADYVETDAVMSGDGVLFTLHNVVPRDHFFVSRQPDGVLNRLPFDRIASCATGRAGKGRIDTLRAILDSIAQSGMGNTPWRVNIEIKGVQGSGQAYETNDYLQRLAQTLQDSALEAGRVLFSSFCLQNIIAMSHLVPQAHYGMLFAEMPETRSIYLDRTDDAAYQYLPFNAAMIEEVFDRWSKGARAGVRLGYLHPEVMTITPEMLAQAAARGAGINCWALFEALDSKRAGVYLDLVRQCRSLQLPLTIISDYIPEMKKILEGHHNG